MDYHQLQHLLNEVNFMLRADKLLAEEKRKMENTLMYSSCGFRL